MSKLFLKQSVISKEEINDLLDYQGKIVKAGITSKMDNKYNPRVRSTSLKKINFQKFPSVNKKLMDLCKVFDPTMDTDKFEVQEYNFLIYNVGDHFNWHIDQVAVKEGEGKRQYSTSTILSLSDDLEGGDFGIKSDDGYSFHVDLNVGETLLFGSRTRHKVYPVTKGKRIVLVAWIYDK